MIILALGSLLAAGCSSKRVLMPPRMDLTEYHRVGLVTFTVENAKGSLHELATERFLADVLDGQPGIEVIELGDADEVLAEIGESDSADDTKRSAFLKDSDAGTSSETRLQSKS